MNGMSFAYVFNHVITVAYTQTYVQITYYYHYTLHDNLKQICSL